MRFFVPVPPGSGFLLLPDGGIHVGEKKAESGHGLRLTEHRTLVHFDGEDAVNEGTDRGC